MQRTAKMNPRAICASALCLVVLGFAGVGKGVWIYTKAIVAQYLLESAWAETMKGGGTPTKPWPWADTWPVTKLSMERLGIDLIVLSGDNVSTLAFGPGHTTHSAAPGAPGVSVISGHRDTHFSFLKNVRPGDEIAIQNSKGDIADYIIKTTEIVDSRFAKIEGVENGAWLTLVTCWPFDAITPGGPMRYVVTAELADKPI